VEEFRPDVVFVWHAIGLSRVLLQEAERLPGSRVVYYLAGYLPELPDEYLSYWQSEPVHWTAKLFKYPLKRLALDMLAKEGKPVRLKYENVICVSSYVRNRLVGQELIPIHSTVIHNGIDLEQFSFGERCLDFSTPLSLLYAGRLEPDKGVHHILGAVAMLSDERRRQISQLVIVGDGELGYCTQLQEATERLGLSSMVRFEPPVPRNRMPALLDRFDVLVLPSSLEALSRMMQEAMAMGLLVIGTVTGGSGELLVHERTGLAFEHGNPKSLSDQLVRVVDEPDLAARMAKAGQREVMQRFDIHHTVEQIEGYLLGIVRGENGRSRGTCGC
jgi:glycosyltransferase involved in cell wall biosynthesis